MRTFTLFVLDDRYGVPTVAFVDAMDEASLAEVATARLQDSPHHHSIEAFENDRPLALFDREGIIWHTAQN